MCYWQIQRAPHGRPWPIVVENAWHVGQHDRHQVCLLELKSNNNENRFVLQKFHINVTINGHQVKITIIVEKSFLQEKLWPMAIGCFVWRVTFGENTIRRGSASPYSQGRKLADTRLVGSCQVTWFHLIAVPWEVVGIYAKCQGRKLQVWSWPYSGESNLGCVPSSIIFESGCSGDHSWHFPVDKGRCRPHEGSSEWKSYCHLLTHSHKWQKESCSGSTFSKNLARYMSTAAEDKKFFDLTIKTRSDQMSLYELGACVWEQGRDVITGAQTRPRLTDELFWGTLQAGESRAGDSSYL